MVDESERYVTAWMTFDTITDLREFFQIMHFFLTSGYNVELRIDPSLEEANQEGRLIPPNVNILVCLSKRVVK